MGGAVQGALLPTHGRAEGDDTKPWQQRMWDVGNVTVTCAPGSEGYATSGVWVLGAYYPGAQLTPDQADELAEVLMAAAADHRARSAMLRRAA